MESGTDQEECREEAIRKCVRGARSKHLDPFLHTSAKAQRAAVMRADRFQ